MARKIAASLALSEADTAYFCDLVEAEHARSAEGRQVALLRLRRSAEASEYHVLGTDAFRAVSDWYHFAILQLFVLKSFKEDAEWIASSLRISPLEAKNALERLERLEMLERSKTGKLKPVKDFVASPDGIPSAAIRKFHRQILEKAAASLEEQDIKNRSHSANFFPLDRRDLNRAKDTLKRFRRRFVKTFGKSSPEAVYCLSMQLFELTATGEPHA